VTEKKQKGGSVGLKLRAIQNDLRQTGKNGELSDQKEQKQPLRKGGGKSSYVSAGHQPQQSWGNKEVTEGRWGLWKKPSLEYRSRLGRSITKMKKRGKTQHRGGIITKGGGYK